MRRRALLGALPAVALGTAGCMQAVSGDTITFEASEAWVADGPLQQHGYQLQNRDTAQIDDTVEIPGLGQRDVEITNHVATYGKADGEGGTGESSSGGAFIALSTPQAQVAGQGTNPLGRMPLEELVKEVASRAGDQSDVEHVETTQVTVLGEETDAEKFSTTTERDGRSVETFVYLTRVGHGDDYVIGAGLVPREFADAEEDSIYALMEGIQHET